MLVTFVLPHFSVKYANLKLHLYQSVSLNANQLANQCESNAGHVQAPFQLAKKPKLSRLTSSSKVSGRYFA